MLFHALDTYLLRHVPARVMPHAGQYVETLNLRRQIIADRFTTGVGYESNLVVLLRKILADADIPALLRKASDLDCYLDVLQYTEPGLSNIFDATTTGLTFRDMAIRRSPTPTVEYLIPVQCADVVASLPLDNGWEAWRSVRPLRLLDVDSLELTFAVHQDQIQYVRDPPSRAIVTIDVVALVLQYVNVLRADASGLSQAGYLHRHVLIHLLGDLEDLWLANLYDALLVDPDRFAREGTAALVGDGFYGFPGSELPIALKELTTMIGACRGGGLTPATLLASLPLSEGTVPGFVRAMIATTTIGERRQNYWMEYLRDRRWLDLIWRCYRLQPEFVATRNLATSLRRDLPILYAQRFWQACHDRATALAIETDLRARIGAL